MVPTVISPRSRRARIARRFSLLMRVRKSAAASALSNSFFETILPPAPIFRPDAEGDTCEFQARYLVETTESLRISVQPSVKDLNLNAKMHGKSVISNL